MELALQAVVTLVLLVGTWASGRWFERRHLASLTMREQASQALQAVTLRALPDQPPVLRSEMVVGSVVVSHDYFKRFSAGLKALFGGRLRAYEPLMVRARREALQRMREAAMKRGHHAVVRVRMETSTLASTQGNQGMGAVEVMAYGTALTFADAPSAT